jgi:hypothetical protein
VNFRKFGISLLIILTTIVGIAASASAYEQNGIMYPDPQVFKYNPNTGGTDVYNPARISSTNICGDDMISCSEGVRGTVVGLYEAIFDRYPELQGNQFWTWLLTHGVTVEQAARFMLDSPEGKVMAHKSNQDFAQTLFYNISDPGCLSVGFKGGCSNGSALDQAAYSATADLDYGRITRAKLVANVVTFIQGLGGMRYNFLYYAQSLQGDGKVGFDLGQLTYSYTIPPYVPCDYYGETSDTGDDCVTTGK